jgi:hypothetical protein
MLTIKAWTVAAVLGAVVAATGGITYVATKVSLQVSMRCPPAAATAPAVPKPDLPQGAPVPLKQGKTY